MADESSHLQRSQFAWSLIDQGLSSGTTFILTVVAARNLGPSGLGVVAIGQAAFYVALGFERSLVVLPLLARISASSRTGGEALRSALSVTLAGGLLFALVAVSAGLSTTGSVARGLLIFAPWVVPALAQELLKSWLYREGRASTSVASSVGWLITMLAAFMGGLRTTDWQIAAAWGLGACAALAVVAAKTDGIGLASPRAAVDWFREEAARLGGWLAISGVVFGVAAYVRLAGMASILGPAAVGGYRAIETAFAPTSLIGPALTNPGLPTLRDAVEHRPTQVWTLALRISLLAVGLAAAYITVVVMARELVFSLLGTEFRRYENLILPIAVGQLVSACSTGLSLLLAATRRMQAIASLIVLQSILSVVLSLPLASIYGLEGAAWGVALAGLPPLLLTIVLARSAARTLMVAGSSGIRG